MYAQLFVNFLPTDALRFDMKFFRHLMPALTVAEKVESQREFLDFTKCLSKIDVDDDATDEKQREDKTVQVVNR